MLLILLAGCEPDHDSAGFESAESGATAAPKDVDCEGSATPDALESSLPGTWSGGVEPGWDDLFIESRLVLEADYGFTMTYAGDEPAGIDAFETTGTWRVRNPSLVTLKANGIQIAWTATHLTPDCGLTFWTDSFEMFDRGDGATWAFEKTSE